MDKGCFGINEQKDGRHVGSDVNAKNKSDISNERIGTGERRR